MTDVGHFPADGLTRVDVRGEPSVMAAEGRLSFAASLVDRRLEALRDARDGSLLPPAWQQAPAFEVHLWSGLGALLADEECRRLLRHIVIHGEAAHVVVFVYGDLDEASEAFSRYSTRLAAELIEGRALRMANSRQAAS